MRNRTLPLALLIAASLAPVAGCSDNDSDANTQQSNDLAAEQTDSSASDDSPLPVNDPDSAQNDPKSSSDDQPDQATPRLDQLQQKIQAMTAAASKRDQRLDAQAQRLDTLEDTVSDLKTRLRRLPQPNHKSDKPSKTPDAVSPQSQTDGQPRESQSHAQGDKQSGSGDKASDDESSSGSADAPSPPADAIGSPADAIGSCDSQRDHGHQFDVFFQGGSDDALNQAIATIKQASIDDWFARRSARRLYLGRYNRCAIAARRRDDVHQRTDLALYIDAVAATSQAQLKSDAHPSRAASTTDYGATDNRPSHAASTRTRPAASLPFRLIGVEIRGTHRFLGVASRGAAQLHAITWLSPGDQYAGWHLQAIQPERERAIFNQGTRAIAVALPDRG